MSTQKQMIEEILITVKAHDELLSSMDNCLRGDKYDPDDHGLVAEVHHNTKCVKDMKKTQYKIVTAGVVIFTAINVLYAIVKDWLIK